MIFIFIFICIIFISKLEFMGENEFNKSYISPQAMLPWKGYFIALIFMSHLMGNWAGHTNIFDETYIVINGYIGQLVVVLFLFLSGYGVTYSVDHRGDNYLRQFPRKRILKTWVHFAVIVLLYWGVQFVLGNLYDYKTVIKAIIGLESLGNSNWYIFAILFLYVVSYIGFSVGRRFAKKKENKKNWLIIGMIITLIATFIYILVFRKVLEYSTVWYDSVICYAVGIFYYLVEDLVLAHVQSTQQRYRCVFIIVFLLFAGNYIVFFQIRPYNYLIYFWIQAILLIALILLFSMKATSGSEVMKWCGQNLFYIYILQRIPFIILDRIGIHNLYLYFTVAVIGTMLLTYVVQRVFKKFDKKV